MLVELPDTPDTLTAFSVAKYKVFPQHQFIALQTALDIHGEIAGRLARAVLHHAPGARLAQEVILQHEVRRAAGEVFRTHCGAGRERNQQSDERQAAYQHERSP